jgi:hypothetical protein
MLNKVACLSVLGHREEALFQCDMLERFCIANKTYLWQTDWAHFKSFIMFEHLKEAREHLNLSAKSM